MLLFCAIVVILCESFLFVLFFIFLGDFCLIQTGFLVASLVIFQLFTVLSQRGGFRGFCKNSTSGFSWF